MQRKNECMSRKEWLYAEIFHVLFSVDSRLDMEANGGQLLQGTSISMPRAHDWRCPWLSAGTAHPPNDTRLFAPAVWSAGKRPH